MTTSKGNSPPRRKLALIIGNDNYGNSNNRLNHSINNANDLNDALKTINFNVTIHRDPKTEMMQLIRNFAETVNDGDSVLFYFSGHACHASGENYLIPIDDIGIEADVDIEDFGCKVKNALDRLVEKNPSCIIFILDCCRPYKLKNGSTSNSKGLLEIQPPDGVFIQYACGVNQAVSDIGDTGRNSLFTKHLLRYITEENIDVIDVFRGIVGDVYRESKLAQRPWSINKLKEQVYLNKVIQSTVRKTSKNASFPLRKLALIIGNNNYNEPHNRLNHSINNANDLRDELNKISFDVATHTDPQTQMMKLIRNFTKTINDGDLILFYFSGHAYQLNGKNYLIPVYDTILQNERDVEEFAVDIEQILTLLVERNPSYVTIVILDCCRPYRLKNVSMSTAMAEGKGLLEIQPRPGVFIQFACSANQTVSGIGDTGRNCLFAKHLLSNITEENVNVIDIFRGIVGDVYRESNLAQRPLSINGLQDPRQVYLNRVIRNFRIKTAASKTDLFHLRKLALIIGNDNYNKSHNRLNHSINNANDLGDSLKNIGFDVTVHTDPDTQMMRLIRNFAKKINDGDLTLFYFSGHAYQLNGKNYLIPVYDTILQNERDVEEFAIDVEQMLTLLAERNPSYVTIVILDCCCPYKLKNALTSNRKGLLEIQPRPGTFIQFACAANQTVSNDQERDGHCLFAKHLLSNITEENVDVIDIFRGIVCDVYRESNLAQRPLSINGLQGIGQVYLKKAIQDFDSKTTTPMTGLCSLQKLALIIGNDKYNEPHNRLNHFINNANELRHALNKISFDVTLHIDPQTQLMKLIREFAKKINDGDLTLFYFSGHAYQLNGKNYLIPVYDTILQNERDVEEFAIDIEQILTLLTKRNPSYVTIVILDCCRPYKLRNASTSNGLLEIQARPRVFIQFACAANQIASGIGDTDHNCLFAKHLLSNITSKDVNVTEVFRRISDSVYYESKRQQKPLSMSRLNEFDEVYLNEVTSAIPNIPLNATWKSNARTVAGGFSPNSTFDRLRCPKGIYVDRNRTIFVADSSNHRIVKYTQGATVGRNIACKNIDGYGSSGLREPSHVIFDRRSKALIISDYHNRRVLRWFRSTHVETLIKNVACGGLTMDDEDFLYVSDTEQHEVRRYRVDDRRGTVVAGGNGQGSRPNQLNHPTYIFVGPDEGVYVSDASNNRVVKWDKGASEGILVAGGKGKGQDRTQLDYPAGLIVDQLGTVYVADHWNNRVMRWYKGASHGELIAGGKYVGGDNANQLNGPEGLAFDSHGNLYVADSNNHRIQRFNIQTL